MPSASTQLLRAGRRAGKTELRKRPFVVLDGEALGEIRLHGDREQGAERNCPGCRPSHRDVVICSVAMCPVRGLPKAKLHEVVCRFSPRLELIAERTGTYALDIRGMNTMRSGETILYRPGCGRYSQLCGLPRQCRRCRELPCRTSLLSLRTARCDRGVGGEADALYSANERSTDGATRGRSS